MKDFDRLIAFIENSIKIKSFAAVSTDLKQVLDKNLLKNALKEVLNNTTLLKVISKKSYRHQNNFDKIVLFESPSGWSIRLHFWNENDSYTDDTGDSDIHNHRWDYSSIVIFGEIEEYIYSESNTNNDKSCIYNKYSFYTDEDDLSHYRYIADINLENKTLNSYKKGSSYYNNHNQLHLIIPKKNASLTFFVQSPPILKESIIYSHYDKSLKNEKHERIGFTEAYLSSKFEKIIRLIL